jgi:hypothetical protein
MSPTNYAHMLALLPARKQLIEAGLDNARRMPQGPQRRQAMRLAQQALERDERMRVLCAKRVAARVKQVSA